LYKNNGILVRAFLHDKIICNKDEGISLSAIFVKQNDGILVYAIFHD
jgi:hypothetical protein